MNFIVEHLDPRLYAWCFLEYKHLAKANGKENTWFTNVKGKKGRERLAPYGKVFSVSAEHLDLGRACVLDPAAKETLTSEDKYLFDSFIFGGILGDYPMKGRTGDLLTRRIKCSIRNLGPEQMSTDTAVIVSKMILEGRTLSHLKFQDNIDIPIAKGESVELPFRYLLVKGKPLLAPGLVEHLKKRRNF
jgi:ribosome biogenesis SPOUT family RNA methylase Rps3